MSYERLHATQGMQINRVIYRGYLRQIMEVNSKDG